MEVGLRILYGRAAQNPAALGGNSGRDAEPTKRRAVAQHMALVADNTLVLIRGLKEHLIVDAAVVRGERHADGVRTCNHTPLSAAQ